MAPKEVHCGSFLNKKETISLPYVIENRLLYILRICSSKQIKKKDILPWLCTATFWDTLIRKGSYDLSDVCWVFAHCLGSCTALSSFVPVPYLVGRPQHRADTEDLVNLAASWEQWLERVQFCHDTPHSPNVDGRTVIR